MRPKMRKSAVRGNNVTVDCVQRYKAFEISIGKRMSNRWQMQGSYVWSRLDGDLVLDYTNPNNVLDFVGKGRDANDQHRCSGAQDREFVARPPRNPDGQDQRASCHAGQEVEHRRDFSRGGHRECSAWRFLIGIAGLSSPTFKLAPGVREVLRV